MGATHSDSALHRPAPTVAEFRGSPPQCPRHKTRGCPLHSDRASVHLSARASVRGRLIAAFKQATIWRDIA